MAGANTLGEYLDIWVLRTETVIGRRLMKFYKYPRIQAQTRTFTDITQTLVTTGVDLVQCLFLPPVVVISHTGVETSQLILRLWILLIYLLVLAFLSQTSIVRLTISRSKGSS